MNNRVSKAFAVILAALLILSVFPMTVFGETEGDYTYEIIDGGAKITNAGASVCGDVIIPATLGGYPVTAIGDFVLWSQDNIVSIALPDSLISIGNNTFSNCENLVNITLPDSLESIGDNVFSDCENLKNISLPESLVSIGDGVLGGCPALSDITIPEGVKYIGNSVFGETAIEKLVIPASVQEIGTDLCYEGRLKEIIVDDDNPYFSSDEYGILFNKEKTELLQFPCLSEVKTYTVPETTKVIGERSFNSQFTVSEIIMADSVEIIENEAFFGCGALEKIRLSENLHTIGDCNFYFCYYLKELTLPSSVKNVGAESFIELYALEKITVYSKDADFSNSLLGFLGLGESVEDHRELAEIYYEYNYAYYYLGDKEQAEKIGEQLYNYDFTENNYGNSYPVYCYRNSGAEAYAVEYGLEYFYLCEEHIPEIIPGTEASCLTSGASEGTKCSVCGEILVYPEEIPAKGHTLGQWINDYENNIATRSCESCNYSETAELTGQGDGDVEIIAPDNPDLNFDIDSVEKNNKTFLLVEQSIKENTTVESEVIKVFDISLKNNDGVNVQPNGTVKVKLPLDWEGKKNYKVYRVNDDGTLTDMNAFQEGSHMVFETDHFSIYVIVEEKSEEKPEDNCSHICHKSGFFGFIWKIVNFFSKLFGINPVCECGSVHY